LARQEDVRSQYDAIAWVALGATPNVEKLQDLLHLQLTGVELGLPAEETDEQHEKLRQAMMGAKLLLVLDGAPAAAPPHCTARSQSLAGYREDSACRPSLKLTTGLADLWEIEAEQALNFVDEAAGAKVLVSSRILAGWEHNRGCRAADEGRGGGHAAGRGRGRPCGRAGASCGPVGGAVV
jgi:hypothetical protein